MPNPKRRTHHAADLSSSRNSSGLTACRYISLASGIWLLRIHSLTDGGLMRNIFAVAFVPPNCFTISETSMRRSLGHPNAKGKARLTDKQDRMA